MGDTGVMIHIQSLIDDAKCFETVRLLRWPEGVSCPHCDSFDITKQGRDDTPPERQRYLCQTCERRFDDLTDTIFAGHHQPLRVWILCLYFMGLNLSNHQIAQELDLNKDDVECDEVSIVAGHKGKPAEVRKKGGAADVDVSRGTVAAAPSQRRSPRSSG